MPDEVHSSCYFFSESLSAIFLIIFSLVSLTTVRNLNSLVEVDALPHPLQHHK